jgi:hypothetical protein
VHLAWWWKRDAERLAGDGVVVLAVADRPVDAVTADESQVPARMSAHRDRLNVGDQAPQTPHHVARSAAFSAAFASQHGTHRHAQLLYVDRFP